MYKNTLKEITALYERSATLDPESIRRQRNNLTNFAKRHNFKNLRHYSDDGISGTNTGAWQKKKYTQAKRREKDLSHGE